ncbi:glycerol-3-phosphate dehydrogenase [Undibacterium sp. Di24W]|uniref:glycerol-3-phosphate dehydrogenase n=1 Tax=Undibacterium sp. Di24W TaxID=3413033 RepID=UPI003BEFDF68
MIQETSSVREPLCCDVLVIGGGINGVGIARDAAGRGLKVILCEKDDLASHTSSASSKLIHGGLRYLEYYEFSLVRKALQEREDLMRLAPHLIRPLRFVMPYVAGLRPRWILRCGLFLYDHLARRDLLPGTESCYLREHEVGTGLKSDLKFGFMYSDAWVDDARLVVLNAMDAQQRGAQIFTRTRCNHLEAKNGRWLAQLSRRKFASDSSDNSNDEQLLVNAACVVNASGAWVADLQAKFTSQSVTQKMRLVKGSHIVVNSLFSHENAYIFQHPDGRIVFAIPYEKKFTLIGTTDIEYQGRPDEFKSEISDEEIAYLCNLSNQYFAHQISVQDVLWSYAGVRPLVDDGQSDSKSITRDYRLELELDLDVAPILHVFGGKITTYRRLAEDALSLLSKPLSSIKAVQPAWTKTALLPGGDLFSTLPDNQNVLRRGDFIQACCLQYPWAPNTWVARLAASYGTRIHRILEGCVDQTSLGDQVLPGLYTCEIRYLIHEEFAQTARDILWRRTKLGLHLAADAESILDNWLAGRS